MELRHLEAFVAVAREGTFTEAAKRLSLTQPSLSARIRQLETDLQGLLFTRESRPVELTETGRIFLPFAERVLGILETAQEAVSLAQSGLTGRLSVGCPVSVSTYLMPDVISQFSQQYPQAELFLETAHSINLVESLLDGVLDIAFTAVFPHLIRQAEILLRIQDHMVVAVPSNHPLAKVENVHLQQIWDFPQILPRWGSSFEAYIRSLRNLAPNPRPMLRIPLAAGMPMLNQSDMITFIPNRLATAINMHVLPFNDVSFPWDVVMITRPGRSLTPLGQCFTDVVREVVSQ